MSSSLFMPKRKKKEPKKPTTTSPASPDLNTLFASVSLGPQRPLEKPPIKPAEKKKKLVSIAMIDIEEIRKIDEETEAEMLVQKTRNMDLQELKEKEVAEYREMEFEEYSSEEEDEMVYILNGDGETVECRE
jgi:hypothetical protein